MGINYSVGNACVEQGAFGITKNPPEYTYISFEEYTPEDIIKTGLGFAICEDWDIIDKTIVPAYRCLTERVGGSEELLINLMDVFRGETTRHKEGGHPRYPDTYLEFTKVTTNTLDYLATMSRELIAVNKKISDELVTRLLDLLNGPTFVRFRAGIALSEASKYDEKLKIYSPRIKEAIMDGVKEEPELEEIAKEYISAGIV